MTSHNDRIAKEQLSDTVYRIVRDKRVTDMHTHLYAAAFKSLLLWELDDLLTYHYLISETFRWLDMPYEQFWALSKREQADLIWQTLFVEHSPVSEAASGIITIFRRLGFDTTSRDLNTYRQAWAQQSLAGHMDQVMEAAGVQDIVMTNDPFDDVERPVWLEQGGYQDSRFYAALRVDQLLNQWKDTIGKLQQMGYAIEQSWSDQTIQETRRFVQSWIKRMDALYLAVSMPGEFRYPGADHRSRMIDDVLIPACQHAGIPLALMIGVKRAANPELRLAGDMSMHSDVASVEALCRRYPQQKFLVTMLARENQHELAVLARKFRNLMVFGCWWFLHIESMVEEMTRMRIELLGTSVIPQHSDCRIFAQLIYKWEHSRTIIAKVLLQKYERLQESGWPLYEADIVRDCDDLFGDNFWRFIGRQRAERRA